mgnify:CR=1 FL=1
MFEWIKENCNFWLQVDNKSEGNDKQHKYRTPRLWYFPKACVACTKIEDGGRNRAKILKIELWIGFLMFNCFEFLFNQILKVDHYSEGCKMDVLDVKWERGATLTKIIVNFIFSFVSGLHPSLSYNLIGYSSGRNFTISWTRHQKRYFTRKVFSGKNKFFFGFSRRFFHPIMDFDKSYNSESEFYL